MIKLISIFLSLLLIFGWNTPVMAQSQPPIITQEQLKQGDEWANQAFAA
ncbi:MAG: tetratricopeptide repeat protein, partial [Nostoc sp.]